ncbi:MAG: hypothetical protein ACXWCM_17670 [Acidimicrobiales bacterium]
MPAPDDGPERRPDLAGADHDRRCHAPRRTGHSRHAGQSRHAGLPGNSRAARWQRASGDACDPCDSRDTGESGDADTSRERQRAAGHDRRVRPRQRYVDHHADALNPA